MIHHSNYSAWSIKEIWCTPSKVVERVNRPTLGPYFAEILGDFGKLCQNIKASSSDLRKLQVTDLGEATRIQNLTCNNLRYIFCKTPIATMLRPIINLSVMPVRENVLKVMKNKINLKIPEVKVKRISWTLMIFGFLIFVGMTDCKNNSACSHLCLLTPTGSQCACPNGFKLLPDNVTCNGESYKKNSSLRKLLLNLTLCFYCFCVLQLLESPQNPL